MAHNNTVFAQLLKLVPRHEFEAAANRHHEGQRLRKMSRWGQFVALGMAQLTGRSSLRDIVSNLAKQSNKLYHLGVGVISRSSLARVNDRQPYTLFEALFGTLLSRCQGVAPKHGFRFRNKLYSFDASTIDLCLSIFPWAKFRRTKGAIKLHAAIDHDGLLPSFVAITDGKVHEVKMAHFARFPKGSIVVIDRGYTDYAWFWQLNCCENTFVIRQKRRARYRVVERRRVDRSRGLTSDQTIVITGANADRYPAALRRVGYRDPETGQRYYFLTNNFKLSAKTIADIYKARWQIELFFKWIKQNLKIKNFVGTSKNAVMTQIWIALCMYLLLAYIKFANRIGWSLQQILRLLHLNLFERRDFLALLSESPPQPPGDPRQLQLKFG